MRRWIGVWVCGVAVAGVALRSHGADGKAKQLDVAAYKRMAMDRNPTDRPALLAGLTHTDPIIRRSSIYGLQRLGDVSSAGRIAGMLTDGDGWVRRTAAVALGRLRAKQAVAALTKVLAHDDVHLRYEAFVALARIGDPASCPAIIKAMKDKRLWTELDVWDQKAIVCVAGRDFFTDRDVIPVLKWLLDYAKWEHPELADLAQHRKAQHSLLIANAAAEMLVKFGDASGEAQLIAGLGGHDYVQQSSAVALGKLKSAEAVPGLIEMLTGRWVASRRRAIHALGAIGDRVAVAPLADLLADPDAGIRRSAARALTAIEGKSRKFDRAALAAKTPTIPKDKLNTPGGKRPPQFICLGVDDCVNIEGLEAILDICQTLADRGSKAVFTLWVAPLAGDPDSRDMLKQSLLH